MLIWHNFSGFSPCSLAEISYSLFTMKLRDRSLVLWLSDRLDKLEENEAKEFLVKRGWRELGSGVENVAYHKDELDFVLKISHKQWFSESASILFKILKKQVEKAIETGSSLFVETEIVECKNFVLTFQEKVDVVLSDAPLRFFFRWEDKRYQLQRKFDMVDFHKFNVGLKKGQFKIFDWLV